MAVSKASVSAVIDTASVETTDRELIFRRTFDAPRELVYEAWTDPRHLVHWWGPRGFTTTVHEINLRPGGDWRLTMRGPDGRDYHNRLVFSEVKKPVRLVYKHVSEPDAEPASHETTVTFADQDGKTAVTMRLLFPSAAEKDRIVETYHAIEGGRQTLERLAERLPAMNYADLVLERTFDAPSDLVFRAFTNPEHMKQWWGPRGFSNPVCQIDAKPGGAILVHMRAPNGMEHPMAGTFLEVLKPERVVMSCLALDAAGNAMFEVINSITLTERSGKTHLTLRASVVRVMAPESAQHLAGMEQGWSQSLERLEFEMVLENSVLVIERSFNAPRELVWKAVTEPERLTQWWGPKGFTPIKFTVDLRRGGMFHYAMQAPGGGPVMWGRWIYRLIEAPERLTSVVSFSNEAAEILPNPYSPVWPPEVLTAMRLTEQGGKTRVQLYSHPINASEEEVRTFVGAEDSMRKGYAGTLDQLEEYLRAV